MDLLSFPPLEKITETLLMTHNLVGAYCPMWQEVQGRPLGPTWFLLTPLGSRLCLPISLPSLACSPLSSSLVSHCSQMTARSQASHLCSMQEERGGINAKKWLFNRGGMLSLGFLPKSHQPDRCHILPLAKKKAGKISFLFFL